MNPRQLAQSFLDIAQGNAALRPPAVRAVRELLASRNALALLQLSVELARLAEPRALAAFDATMNLLTCEPAALPGLARCEWRAYAMTTVFERPAGAVLSRPSNVRAVEHALAVATGIAPRDLRVVEVQVATPEAYAMPPADVYGLCLALKAAAERESSPLGRRGLGRQALGRGLPRLAFEAANGWQSRETELVNDEALFMVLVRGGVSPHDCDGIEGRPRVSFAASYQMDAGRSPDMQVQHEMVSLGAPWEQFRASLHTAQAFGLCRLMAREALARQCTRHELRAHLAVVDSPLDGGTTTRVAVLHPVHGPVLGVVEHNLAEPDQFTACLARLLDILGFGELTVSDSAFSSAEVDRGGRARVLVPGRGWLEADPTFQSFNPA